VGVYLLAGENMNTRQISFQGDKTAKAAHISDNHEINKAIEEMRIPHPRSVIVLVGGAGGIGWWDKFPMRKAIKIIARLAEETQSIVVDGGTQAGIMTEIGGQRKRNKYSFPLIGVVFDSLLMKKELQSILDPNHTHFFLIPGDNWGDESAWISKIATHIAVDKKSITVLVNGGKISRTDVGYSVLEDRPTFVMRGTGRMADQITLGEKIIPINISQKPDDILEFLKLRLT
jgi:TRPM family ion channel